MRQLADEDSLKQSLPGNEIGSSTIELLALTLARFYQEAATGPEIDRFGAWEFIRKNCDENFRQTLDHADTYRIGHRRLRIVEAATQGFLDRRWDLFAERVQEGRIQDCHGDLRTDHVYLTDQGLQIIDCIEFNNRFRYGDVASDLAFLAMELDHQGGVIDFGSGIYSEEATSLTYAHLLLLAQVELEKGRSVVLDATFSRKEQRREALRLAEEMGVWIIFVQCTCSEATIRKRLLARTDDNSLSDARIHHLDHHKNAFEKMDDLSSQCLIRLETERSVEESLGAIFAYISSPNDCLERGWLPSDL